jgi:hypothetical protein
MLNYLSASDLPHAGHMRCAGIKFVAFYTLLRKARNITCGSQEPALIEGRCNDYRVIRSRGRCGGVEINSPDDKRHAACARVGKGFEISLPDLIERNSHETIFPSSRRVRALVVYRLSAS